MVYVPVPHTPSPPSPRVQELEGRISEVIEEYQRRFPNLSASEIRQAVDLAVQRKARGGGLPGRQALAAGLGLAAFLAGLVAFFVQEGSLEGVQPPWILIAVVGMAILGVGVLFLARRE